MVPPLPRIVYDVRLVEESVFLAIRSAAPVVQARFRIERDRVYGVKPPAAFTRGFGGPTKLEERSWEDRELRFQDLHGRWFSRLGLDDPLRTALGERAILGLADLCRLITASSRRAALADLFRDDGSTTVVLLVTPDQIANRPEFLNFLRHELLHVADMLDPAFGYESAVPPEIAGTPRENLFRDRYRVVWDATIDGRLTREGRGLSGTRRTREQEFTQTFPMLGAGVEQEFGQWFDEPSPTHDGIIRFVLEVMAGAADTSGDGRCPLCRFPTMARDMVPLALDSVILDTIEQTHAPWHRDQLVCRQCADLLDAKYQPA